MHHVLRRDYGTFSLSLHEDEVGASDTLARSLASLGEVWSAGLVFAAWFGALVLVAVLVGAGLAWRRAPQTSRLRTSTAIGWALSVLASALLFPAAQNIDPASPFGAWILERFDLLTVLCITVPVALALGWVIERILDALSDHRVTLFAGAVVISAAVFGAQLLAVLERGRPATEAGVQAAAIDLVEQADPSAPPIPSQGEPVRAIVFGTDDHRSFPVLYVQEVLGAGSHTLYIDAQLLAHPWYRARLRERVPSLPDVDKPLRMIGAIWSDPELAHVPIYLANVFSAPAARLAKVPEGVAFRVVPPSEHPSFAAGEWTGEAIVARHLAACSRHRARPADFAGVEHPRGHPWSLDLRAAYIERARALAASVAASATPGRDQEIEAIAEALARTTGAEL
jgi:hypothetical protein